nr:hypothetical protein [uncultured Celeribacter sp.]
MTTFPVDYLACLPNRDVEFSLQRFDELSGSADGRHWSSGMSKPLWAAEVQIDVMRIKNARAVDAKVAALEGVKHDFLFRDPSYRGPALDPFGAYLGASDVVVAGIADDRKSIILGGLPNYYELSAGDRLSINFGVSSVWLGSISHDVISNSSGEAEIAVEPWVSLGVAEGAAVEMVAPVVKMFVVPDGYKPFRQTRRKWGLGASLSLLQRVV